MDDTVAEITLLARRDHLLHYPFGKERIFFIRTVIAEPSAYTDTMSIGNYAAFSVDIAEDQVGDSLETELDALYCKNGFSLADKSHKHHQGAADEGNQIADKDGIVHRFPPKLKTARHAVPGREGPYIPETASDTVAGVVIVTVPAVCRSPVRLQA